MKTVIIDFSENSNQASWQVVDDVVMGGRSSGNFARNESGNALFFGKVSTENYGGFSSVRFRFPTITLENQTHVVLRVKGDGKNYQLRIKDKVRNYYSYAYTFSTSGDWETIRIPLNKMEPVFRGRRLNFSNFQEKVIQELGILIGNKRNETFSLEIDKIGLN